MLDLGHIVSISYIDNIYNHIRYSLLICQMCMRMRFQKSHHI